MRVADEILDEFRQGKSVSEVRKKYRSKSQLYEALDRFLLEAESVVQEKRETLQKASEELSETQAELERVKAAKKAVSYEVEELRDEKENLDSEVPQLIGDRNALRAEVEELQKRGYTPAFLKKMRGLEPRNASLLWSDLKTVTRCREVLKETEVFRREKTTLQMEVEVLKRKKKETAETFLSEQNRLDDLRLQAAIFRDALDIVSSFFEDGFSTDDLRSLKFGVDLIGIKNEPRASVMRLLESLRDAKSLIELNRKVDEKRKELALLNGAVAISRKEGQITTSVVLKSLEEIRVASMKAIADVAEKGVATNDDSAKDFERRTKDILSKVELQAQQTIQGVKAELKKLEGEKARSEELLAPARWLFLTLESQEYANSLPLPIVSRIADRLSRWCEVKVKGFSVRPSGSIYTADFAFLPLQEYKLVACAALLSEGIRQFMLRKDQNDRGLTDSSARST
jgi:FtsZ-binding cell division protein ZapB